MSEINDGFSDLLTESEDFLGAAQTVSYRGDEIPALIQSVGLGDAPVFGGMAGSGKFIVSILKSAITGSPVDQEEITVRGNLAYVLSWQDRGGSRWEMTCGDPALE